MAMKRKTEGEKDIFGLGQHLFAMCQELNAEVADYATLQQQVADLEQWNQVLNNPRYAGHEKHLQNLKGALEKQRTDKAILHLDRLRAVVRPVANDSPYDKGDRVSIARYEHGWEPGVDGTVKERITSTTGVHSYIVEDDDGHRYDVDHTRDLYLIKRARPR